MPGHSSTPAHRRPRASRRPQNPDFQKKLPYLAAAAEATSDGLPCLGTSELSQMITVVSQNISAMVTGQKSLDDGMAAAQDAVLNILVQSGRYNG